jgi:hypothetical protein
MEGRTRVVAWLLMMVVASALPGCMGSEEDPALLEGDPVEVAPAESDGPAAQAPAEPPTDAVSADAPAKTPTAEPAAAPPEDAGNPPPPASAPAAT